MTPTTYHQILDILSDTSTDFKEIAVRLAKLYPETFLWIANNTDEVFWTMEACRIVETDGKVQAIKYVRSQTGWGLKESKETVEQFIEEHDLKIGGTNRR